MLRSRNTVLLALLVLLALALRLFHLGRYSLWLDEGTTWWNATRATWLEAALSEFNQRPVWWLVTRASILGLGDSEAALRFPAALCGTIAVGLTILLGRRLFRDEPGIVLLLAVLAATNTFLIDYAQEARMYSGLLVEAVGLSLLVFAWLDRPRVGTLVAYCALAIVALMTHLFAVWPMAGHALFVLVLALRERSRAALKRVAPFWATQAIALLLVAAWVALTMTGSYGAAAGRRFDALARLLHSLWRIGVGPALAAVDRPRVDAGLRAFVHDEFVVIALSALLWVLPLVLGAIALRRRPEAFAFLASGILVPIAALLAIQSRLPLMHEKYLIFLAPLLLATAAFGAVSAPRPLRPILIGGLILLNAAGLAAYHFPNARLVSTLFVHGHPHGHESWRELHATVDAAPDSGTTVVLAHGYLDRVWLYYDRGRHPLVLLPEPDVARPARDRALVAALGSRATFVFAHDFDADRRADLATIARAARLAPADVEARVTLLPSSWGIRVLEWCPPPRFSPEAAALR